MNTNKRRVAVTGMGILSSIGNDAKSVWSSIENKKCGIRPISSFDTAEYKAQLAGQVDLENAVCDFSKKR